MRVKVTRYERGEATRFRREKDVKWCGRLHGARKEVKGEKKSEDGWNHLRAGVAGIAWGEKENRIKEEERGEG